MPVCIPQVPEGLASGSRSIPPSGWSPALLFSRGALPVRSSGSVRGIGWSSWLSPLPAAWLRFVVFSRFPVVWLVLQLPPMRALRSASLRPLGCSTVSYLGFRRCELSSTLVFSVPLLVGSSWAPLSRFSWSWAFLQTGVFASAYWSCLRGPLRCILLLSPCGLPLVCFLGFFFRPSVCCRFSLLFFRPSCPSVSSLCQSGAVFWASCPFGSCGSRFSHPLAVSHVSLPCLCSCLSHGFLWLGWLCPLYPSVVLRRLPSVRRPSLGYGPTRSLSLLRFFGPFLGALLSALSSFFAFWSPLGSPFRSVAMSSGLLFSAGSVFLPSLPGWSVGFSRVSAALPSLCGQGRSSPGCPCSLPSDCLCSAPFLPSSPAPLVACGLVVVLSPG